MTVPCPVHRSLPPDLQEETDLYVQGSVMAPIQDPPLLSGSHVDSSDPTLGPVGLGWDWGLGLLRAASGRAREGLATFHIPALGLLCLRLHREQKMS